MYAVNECKRSPLVTTTSIADNERQAYLSFCTTYAKAIYNLLSKSEQDWYDVRVISNVGLVRGSDTVLELPIEWLPTNIAVTERINREDLDLLAHRLKQPH